jgi:preprotein translocase subunit SecG
VSEKLKKISNAVGSVFKGRSVPVAVLLIVVVLLSAGSGLYAGASFFAPQASNVTVTTTIYTTTTSWTTLTVWSTVTSTVQGVLTTVQYTTSTSTVTVTGGTSTPVVVTVGGTSTYGDWAGLVLATRITLPAGATIQSIGINWESTTPGSIRLALYDAGANGPNHLLTQSADTAMSASAGWQDLPVTSYTLSSSGTYWVAFQATSHRYMYASTGGTISYYAKAYGPFDATWSASSSLLYPYYTQNLRVTYTTGT